MEVPVNNPSSLPTTIMPITLGFGGIAECGALSDNRALPTSGCTGAATSETCVFTCRPTELASVTPADDADGFALTVYQGRPAPGLVAFQSTNTKV